MRKRKVFKLTSGLWAVILGMSCFSCGGGDDSSSPQEEVTQLQVSTTSVTLNEQNTGTFTVTSNTSWTVFPLDSWLQCTPSSGTNTQSVSVSATSPHSGSEARKGSLVITSQDGSRSLTVTVVQNPPIIYHLTIDQTALSFSADAGSAQLNISTNDEWVVTGSNTWCTLSSVAGNGSATITVQVAANTDYSTRSAVLTISGQKSGVKKTVDITQEAAADPSVVGRDDYEGDESLDGSSGGSDSSVVGRDDYDGDVNLNDK